MLVFPSTPIHGIIGMTALAMDCIDAFSSTCCVASSSSSSSSGGGTTTTPTPSPSLSGATALTFTEELKDHLMVVTQSGEVLLGIANTVLDLARIEAGHLQLLSVPFNVRSVVVSTMRMLQVREGAGGGDGGSRSGATAVVPASYARMLSHSLEQAADIIWF